MTFPYVHCRARSSRTRIDWRNIIGEKDLRILRSMDLVQIAHPRRIPCPARIISLLHCFTLAHNLLVHVLSVGLRGVEIADRWYLPRCSPVRMFIYLTTVSSRHSRSHAVSRFVPSAVAVASGYCRLGGLTMIFSPLSSSFTVYRRLLASNDITPTGHAIVALAACIFQATHDHRW